MASSQPPKPSAGPWRLEVKGQPKPPLGGLPPRTTPTWVRIVLRAGIFPFMLLDLLMQSLVRKAAPPPYRIEGGCKMRGNCCHYILMEWDPLMDRWPWLGRFWMWWYTQIHGFYPRGFDVENVDGRVARVMGCRHLQEDGRCGEYRLRPSLCRQWPRIEYAAAPYVLKGCGYIPVSRNPERNTQEGDASDVAKDASSEARDEAMQAVRKSLDLSDLSQPPGASKTSEE